MCHPVRTLCLRLRLRLLAPRGSAVESPDDLHEVPGLGQLILGVRPLEEGDGDVGAERQLPLQVHPPAGMHQRHCICTVRELSFSDSRSLLIVITDKLL